MTSSYEETKVEWEGPPPPGANGADADNMRFAITPFDQIKHTTACQYLVKGLVPSKGLTLVYGEPKCGKSFWAFDIVMHIALGRSYRSRRVEQGAVVYISCEGFGGFHNRVEAFRQELMADHTGPVPFWLLAARVDLVGDHGDIITDIRTTLGDTGPSAIVIDTLNRSMVGSESKDQDMAAYLKAAETILDTFNCAVIIIHHTGIDATRPRGHTSLTGAVDAQLSVKRNGDENIVVSVEWMKDGAEGATLASKLKTIVIGTDNHGDDITSCVVEPVDNQSNGSTARPKLSPSMARAYELLCRAIISDGQPAPASNHIPSGKNTCPVTVWREYCFKGQISAGTNRDSFKRAFNRAAEKLEALGFIGVWDGLVWCRDNRDKVGQA